MDNILPPKYQGWNGFDDPPEGFRSVYCQSCGVEISARGGVPFSDKVYCTSSCIPSANIEVKRLQIQAANVIQEEIRSGRIIFFERN